ncbi:hypothetical protein JAAARDRAFT_39557 [Jaapia argillacea MUCL 33604]|uniref:NADH-ubiquinone oxidoreductase 12 kDa subunit n=1 Tax=Jaapia argillacea MUCL 33604 TaxID=933084 RepID=A0A067PEI0_9AGAM|nr:hypothetical protein JAAARDRAFT_39557 [Jaapia argillacea MUCL 33604]
MATNVKADELQARMEARDKHIRESWIQAMEARVVHQALQKCQRIEGVNSYENCKEFSERYIVMLRENKVKGYKEIDLS